MTNMRHKSVDARKKRHNRYKAAINPIREAYGCTAAEAGPLVMKELTRNNALQVRLEEEQQKNTELRLSVKKLEDEIKKLEDEIKKLKS